MRVDPGPAPTTMVAELDTVARVKRAGQAVRRRWYLVLALTVLGAALGWWSTPSGGVSPGERTRYYRATHTLLRDQDPSTPANQLLPAVGLAQAAYLVGKGDVPAEVAKQLGVDVSQVEGLVVGVPRREVNSIEIQALGTDPTRASALADTAADVLLAQLNAEAKDSFDKQLAEITSRIDRLEGDIRTLEAAIAASPADERLEAQRRSLTNQYSLAYEQFTQLANQPAPSADLVSLQDAKAEEISKKEFTDSLDDIREGLPYVTGVATTVPKDQGSAGLSGPSEGVGATTRAALGGIVGFALAIALILVLDRIDTRLRHRDDVELHTGLPVIAEIPRLSHRQQANLEVVAHTEHRSRAAEGYRVVRSALMFAVDAEPPRPEGRALVVMVTSALPEEGKTTTVANLASVLAEGGFRVLVINCDFRRPRVHRYLLASEAPAQNRGDDGQSSVVISSTRIERVKLVTGVGEGDPDANPLEIVAMQRRIIEMARARYDVILLDTAPFLTTNDASELLADTDQVVLVVRAGRTRALSARRTVEILERFEAPVLGVVMNDSDETPAAQYYYNYYLDGSRKKRSEGDAGRANGSGAPAGPERVLGAVAEPPRRSGEAISGR